MESASVSGREADVAERETQKAREGAVRLEAEVKRLSTHLADLNSSYRLVRFFTITLPLQYFYIGVLNHEEGSIVPGQVCMHVPDLRSGNEAVLSSDHLLVQ